MSAPVTPPTLTIMIITTSTDDEVTGTRALINQVDRNVTFSNSSLMGGVKWDDTHSAASVPMAMASFTVATPSLTMTESVSP